MIIRPLLGNMAFKCPAGEIERGLAAKRRQRFAPIHLHRILLVQMEIQFLHLPRFAVRHFLLIVFIRRQRNGRLSRVRRRPMRAVAVFAVHVLRHHDVRPARAVSLGDKTIDASGRTSP